MIYKLNSLARSYRSKNFLLAMMLKKRSTYLQAFYFSLESENVVFHIAAVKAVLALLFGGRWAFAARFLVMYGQR